MNNKLGNWVWRYAYYKINSHESITNDVGQDAFTLQPYQISLVLKICEKTSLKLSRWLIPSPTRVLRFNITAQKGEMAILFLTLDTEHWFRTIMHVDLVWQRLYFYVTK